jgi:hypothetical protein
MLRDEKGRPANSNPYKSQLDFVMRKLTTKQVKEIESYIDKQIGASECVLSSKMGANWRGTPLEMLRNCDPTVYDLAFGAFLWRAISGRPDEQWRSIKRNDEGISGRYYWRDR